jgi:leader peptidase (prepilin peptidase) / N-methyltransferase
VTALGLFYAAAAVLGAVVGSFANVCIHRLPRGESVVTPPSRCPACGARIAFYDNVPVVSFLLLRGRCRRCGAKISARYPLVEGASALLFLLSAAAWGPSLDALRGALLGAACVVLVATDLSDRILPDEVTLGGLALGVALALLEDLTRGGGFSFGESRLVDALLGAALGGGLLLLVRAAYRKWRRAEGLGLGDVKMLGMIGAFTGPAGAFLAVFAGSLAGSVLGLSAATLRRAVWWSVSRRVARDPGEAAAAARKRGVLVGADGRVLAAGPPWAAIPGAAGEGEPLSAASATARPVAAVARLARRRGASGPPVRSGRIVVDDGEEFFRVYAAQAVPAADGWLVLLDRADIPFGVFLAVGALVAFAAGRPLLQWAGLPVPPPAGLLP